MEYNLLLVIFYFLDFLESFFLPLLGHFKFSLNVLTQNKSLNKLVCIWISVSYDFPEVPLVLDLHLSHCLPCRLNPNARPGNWSWKQILIIKLRIGALHILVVFLIAGNDLLLNLNVDMLALLHFNDLVMRRIFVVVYVLGLVVDEFILRVDDG